MYSSQKNVRYNWITKIQAGYVPFIATSISWRHRQPQFRKDVASRARGKNRPVSRQRRDPVAVFVHNTHTNSPHFSQD